MTLTGFSWWGFLIGSIFTFVSAAIWFGPKTFYPVWIKAKGMEAPTRETASSPLYMFGGTIASILVEVFSVGYIVNSIQSHQPNVGIIDGAGIGLVLGLGIAAFNSLPHRLFSMDSYKVWIIECANDVLNFMVVAAIFAYMNH